MHQFSNPVIATNEMIIISAVLGFEEEKCCFFFIINEARALEETLNPVSSVGSTWNLAEIGQLISEEKVFNNIMILYMYTAYT